MDNYIIPDYLTEEQFTKLGKSLHDYEISLVDNRLDSKLYKSILNSIALEVGCILKDNTITNPDPQLASIGCSGGCPGYNLDIHWCLHNDCLESINYFNSKKELEQHITMNH